MGKKTEDLERKLREAGLSTDIIRAAWPKWWSNEAELSPSALNDLKFSLSRRLGLSSTSLFDEGDAVFVWKGEAKFKGLTILEAKEREILKNFAVAVAKPLLKCVDERTKFDLRAIDPQVLRFALLANGAPAVDIWYVLRLLLSLGIPTVYLRRFPLDAKRMTAMVVCVDGRFAIFLAKESGFLAPILFYLSHEFGHIVRGHLSKETALVDLDFDDLKELDFEEREANEFAMALLTGQPEPMLEVNRLARNSVELAEAVRVTAVNRKIDPGVLAMSYGYNSGHWPLTFAALNILYGKPEEIWRDINQHTVDSIKFDRLSQDHREFLLEILGLSNEL